MSQRLFGLKMLAAAAVVGLGSFASSANADTPDLSLYGWMAETDPGVAITVLNQVGDTLTLQLEKQAQFTTNDPLKIQFFQTAITDQAVSKIIIKEESITNSTGTDWNGFRFVLEGNRAGADGVPTFDTAASGNFGNTPFTTETVVSNTEIQLSGGTLPSSNTPAGTFHPGQAPGSTGDLVINASPFRTGSVLAGQNFIFKEIPMVGGGGTPPVIPLPAAAWTSLSGLLGLGLISNAKKMKKILS
jgi:hypothetical protein